MYITYLTCRFMILMQVRLQEKKLINRHRVQPFINAYKAVFKICYNSFSLSNLFHWKLGWIYIFYFSLKLYKANLYQCIPISKSTINITFLGSVRINSRTIYMQNVCKLWKATMRIMLRAVFIYFFVYLWGEGSMNKELSCLNLQIRSYLLVNILLIFFSQF